MARQLSLAKFKPDDILEVKSRNSIIDFPLGMPVMKIVSVLDIPAHNLMYYVEILSLRMWIYYPSKWIEEHFMLYIDPIERLGEGEI